MNKNDNKIFINEDWYYTISKIKNRIIFAPCEKLKKKQRFFLNAIKWEYPLSLNSVKVAKLHAGKKWVLKMDIKDFYNSIPYSHIEIVIMEICKHINNSDISNYLDLTTVGGKLPTGAPTSAHIANACFKMVDLQIKEYCSLWRVNYLRYVDDLIFSSDEKCILKMVEKRVEMILNEYGYRINNKKQSIFAKTSNKMFWVSL